MEDEQLDEDIPPSTEPPEAETMKATVANVEVNTGCTGETPEVPVRQGSTTDEATKDGEDICPTVPKVDEDKARFISESVVVGGSTGIKRNVFWTKVTHRSPARKLKDR